MECLELGKKDKSDKKVIRILIFAEGTVLKPRKWYTLYSHKSYVPVGNAVEKISSWQKQGAEIIYCTSRKGKQAEDILNILQKYNFSGEKLIFRSKHEKYKDLVEKLKPDVLVEDDCRSIGGAWQMCINHVEPELKKKIYSLVVKEFKGIDNLPNKISDISKL